MTTEADYVNAAEAAKVIARGGQPGWEQTFSHPVHGDLTFKVPRLPTGQDWLQVGAVQERIAPGVTQGGPLLLAEATAGLITLADRPVLHEERVDDPDTPGRVRLEQTFYDPLTDEDYEFPIVVWTAFTVWRREVLSERTVTDVKNSSGATSISLPVAPSPVITD